MSIPLGTSSKVWALRFIEDMREKCKECDLSLGAVEPWFAAALQAGREDGLRMGREEQRGEGEG